MAAEVEGYDLPGDVYYHKEHMWARVEGDVAVVGLNDFSQKLAGELSYIEMPEQGTEVEQGEVVGTYETGKWMGKLFAPLSGEIVRYNEEAEEDPALVNSEPYGKGWLFEIRLKDASEVENLMKGSEAADWLKGEIEKHAQK